MIVSPAPTTLTTAAAMNTATVDKLAAYTQQIALGDTLRGLATELFQQTPQATGADPYNGATLQVFHLPDDAKASTISRAYARGGTRMGEYTPTTANATPTAGQIAVTPSGDIAVVGTDAPTGMDIRYAPVRGDVYQFTLPVVAGILTIPPALTTAPAGVILLEEAEALVGTVVGKKIVLAPAADDVTLPATTKACLSVDKTLVLFNNATDAVTSARVKLLVSPGTDINTILEAAASF